MASWCANKWHAIIKSSRNTRMEVRARAGMTAGMAAIDIAGRTGKLVVSGLTAEKTPLARSRRVGLGLGGMKAKAKSVALMGFAGVMMTVGNGDFSGVRGTVRSRSRGAGMRV